MADVQVAVRLGRKTRPNPRRVKRTSRLHVCIAGVACPSFAGKSLRREIGLNNVAQKISRNGSVGFRGHTRFLGSQVKQ